MLITVNDIPEMREVFSGLKMETMDIHDTVVTCRDSYTTFYETF